MNILILEDDLSTAIAIEMIIYDLGSFHVHMASTIKEAEKILGEKELQLIIADIMLEDVNSLEWLGNHTEAPKIIITGNYSEDHAAEARSIGAEAYLPKPLNTTTLKFEIERQLGETYDLQGDDGVIISDGGKIHVLKPKDVIWIKTEGNYSTIKTINHKIVLKKSLSRILDLIDSKLLTRVHRSAVVALSKVNILDTRVDQITMIDGQILPLSKALKDKVISLINNTFTKKL